MKKLFITIAFVAASMIASAQLFVGGNIGMGVGFGKFKSSDSEETAPKTLVLEVAPTLGFMFSEEMGVGLDIMFRMNQISSASNTTKTTSFGFAPFFRYAFAEINSLKFYADAKFNYLRTDGSNTVNERETTYPKTTEIGFGIIPGVQYYLTDNIFMNCTLNIFGLGFQTEKTDFSENSTKTSTTVAFGVNYATPVTVGFFYTF